MLKIPKSTTPVSRENYTLHQIKQVFPGGAWVDEPEVSELEGESKLEAHGNPPSIAIIGGTKYDSSALMEYLGGLPQGTTVYVGAGRGVESDLAKADGLTVQVEVVDVNPGRFGRLARKVNVPDVLVQDISSPVVLVGAGERVKQAQSWLKMFDGQRDETNRREVVLL